MLKLDLTSGVARFVTALEAKQSLQIWNKVVALMKDPRLNDSIDIGEGFFRTDIGEYRIVYKFDAKCLYVSVVGKRNDDAVYRKLKNKNRRSECADFSDTIEEPIFDTLRCVKHKACRTTLVNRWKSNQAAINDQLHVDRDAV